MYELSTQQILAIWDSMQHQHSVDKALTILAFAVRDISPKKLPKLTLGQRNNLLLKIRQQLFGDQMICITRCIHCQESLEFALNVHEICAATKIEQKNIPHTIAIEGYKFHFRLLDSEDLMLSFKETNADSIYYRLIKRSLLEVRQEDGDLIDILQLPESILQQYVEHLQRCDSQAEILLTLSCLVCNQQWKTSFDIVSFLCQEIEAYAKQLLYEVHLLAVTYSWTEDAILAMTHNRRQYYLDIVMATP